MFFKKCVFPFLAAVVCAAALFLPQFLGEEPLFAGAESYLFYTGSASSQAYIVPAGAENAAAVRRSLFGRTGESAVYARAEDALAQAEAYGARLASLGIEVTMRRFMHSRHGFTIRLADEWAEAQQLIIDTINRVPALREEV